jgi:hypothetical protein
MPITLVQSAWDRKKFDHYHASKLGEKFSYPTGILVLLLTLALSAIFGRYSLKKL